MNLDQFSRILNTEPSNVTFAQTLAVIQENFSYQPTGFNNGPLRSEPLSNEGSCKLFALAKHLGLSDMACLHCFGDYYRMDVLNHPVATDHGNIRQFLITGLQGVNFDVYPLQPIT